MRSELSFAEAGNETWHRGGANWSLEVLDGVVRRQETGRATLTAGGYNVEESGKGGGGDEG